MGRVASFDLMLQGVWYWADAPSEQNLCNANQELRRGVGGADPRFGIVARGARSVPK